MKFVADLHIHSHFSRATSKNLTFEYLARWAQLKGVNVVGTGDIAHPGWLAEMREKLTPAEEGLYRLKDEYVTAVQAQVPPACQGTVRFILGGEISNIYKKGDKTRKIHNVVFAPSFDAVEKLQASLERIGNIRSDGRPILGLDARDLLEIILEVDPACHLIPAHIWTPWFSLLGSKSGFDSVEECFADLAPHIFALETGLSSDPPMNWRVSALDRYTLVSNSDAHSPEKLGREVNLFDTELSYPALFSALRTGDPAAFRGTVEFFPEEGKYHFDGHRACGIAWDPPTTLAHNGICPVCGKPVTVGVMHRVETLADRSAGERPARTNPFHRVIPLSEVLSEICGVGVGSRQVEAEYTKLLGRLGPELGILRDLPLAAITAAGGERLAEGIGRMRRGEVVAEAGYDGEYGVIRLFRGLSAPVSSAQIGLFADEPVKPATVREETPSYPAGQPLAPIAKHPLRIAKHPLRIEPTHETGAPSEVALDRPEPVPLCGPSASSPDGARRSQPPVEQESALLDGLNPEQRAAVLCTGRPLVIVAGPGTGKTRTLTVRIAYLIQEQAVAPEAILAVTFTNKAADEMRKRLDALLGAEVAGRVTVKTFHAFGAALARQWGERLALSPHFAICTEEDRQVVLKRACPELRQGEIDAYLEQISDAKNRLLAPDAPELAGDGQAPLLPEIYRRYDAAMRAADALDFDDLIFQAVQLFVAHPDVLASVRARYRWISVDEYQDINQAQYLLLRLLTAPDEIRDPQGACPECFAIEGACPEPVEGACPEPVEGMLRDVNLCVIGDPDQAIYGFRGADRRYFLRFEQDYPGAVMLHLGRNYRSSQRILDAAQQVIARNPDRRALQIFSDFVDEVKLDVYAAPTDKAEAEYVVHQVEQMVGGTSYFSLDSGRASGETPAAARAFADFAVLYRLGTQSRLLIEAFDRSGIPYQTASQTPLYAHKIVREVLAYLWLLHNPHSRLHLQTALAVVGPFAKWPYDSWADVLSAAATPGVVTAAQQRRLAGLAAFWRELEESHRGTSIVQLIERISGFIAQERGAPLDDADAERLHQLRLRAAPFADRLAGFLEATALHSETDAYDPRADRVALMSLHTSKGLEFPVVFIIGCEEGLLPYERKGEAVDVEEERRLFYVGMTRAQHKLVLTHARKRVLFGQFMENRVSRFVDDIETALKEAQAMRQRSPKKPPDTQLSLF